MNHNIINTPTIIGVIVIAVIDYTYTQSAISFEWAEISQILQIGTIDLRDLYDFSP